MTVIRNAAATRQRLIDAARAEFAQYGLAGSRVDRIAANAGANKAQIYHYFGGKDQLFDAVWQSVVQQVIESIPIDATDLAGYAERLADTYREHPEIRRLVSWQRLERGHDGPHLFAVHNAKATVEAIARAQADGTVADHFEPGVLLALIINVASLWTTSSSLEVLTVADVSDPKRQCEIIRDAVECLLGR
jgi:AcrR family transcriptional regulator